MNAISGESGKNVKRSIKKMNKKLKKISTHSKKDGMQQD